MKPYPARRWLAGLAVVGALLTASTGIPAAAEAPAAAAAPAADVAIYANSVTVAPDGPQKWVELNPVGSRRPSAYTVRVDRSAVAAFADVEEEGERACTTEGAIITCTGDDKPDSTDLLSLRVTARAGAEVGQRGELLFTVTVPGVGTGTYRSTVAIGEGVDLATESELSLDGTLGSSVTVPLRVANAGTKTVNGAVLYVFGSYGFTPSKRYENCEYSDSVTEMSGFACTFDDSLAPGAAVGVDPTFGGTIPADSWAPNRHLSWAFWFTPADWAEFRNQYRPEGPLGPKGTDPALKLVPVSGAQARSLGQTDTESVNNDTTVTLTVAGDQRADAAAVGATVTGAVGATVPMTVGYTNNGPARAGADGQQGLAIATMVTLPVGVTAVTVSKSCVDPTEEEWLPGKPGARHYECTAGHTIARGERATFEFGLRIDRPGSQSGTVKLYTYSGDGPLKDLNPANDSAKIMVNPAGGGGGSLPITGASTGLIAGLGGLLIALGVGGYLLSRRRHTRFAA
ncbi:LPXTG cell wall anchor domain-containing protein [Micromonospora sp. NBC_00858]|uniref:LPXTG cell wall anchor domain-containing protein n=1 Tax=Micromonospora sp. NBC_00858 TaxID=2975979 RepID=UPI0038663A18|nr:LPXTG cell wall anchor domain-containing protein [Micromonospora sp. NBC_00858]